MTMGYNELKNMTTEQWMISRDRDIEKILPNCVLPTGTQGRASLLARCCSCHTKTRYMRKIEGIMKKETYLQ